MQKNTECRPQTEHWHELAQKKLELVHINANEVSKFHVLNVTLWMTCVKARPSFIMSQASSLWVTQWTNNWHNYRLQWVSDSSKMRWSDERNTTATESSQSEMFQCNHVISLTLTLTDAHTHTHRCSQPRININVSSVFYCTVQPASWSHYYIKREYKERTTVGERIKDVAFLSIPKTAES